MKTIRKILSNSPIGWAKRKVIKASHNKKVKEILRFYKELETTESELLKAKAYLAENGLNKMTYSPDASADFEILKDENALMYHVTHEGKKLYFPQKWTEGQVRSGYRTLMTEQRTDSAHAYGCENCFVESGDIIADVGAAEAVWALTHIEKVKKVYLFECSPEWLPALEKTFAPWRDKVEIVSKYVSNKTEGEFITLDNFFKDKPVNYIKADIEGFEQQMMQGAAELLKRKDVKFSVCVYHKEDDGKIIGDLLKANKYETRYSNGFLIPFWDVKIKPPYTRHGVINAWK